jgi:hypothetical protein
MLEKLKNKWKIESNLQLATIIVVFAINGSLSARISKIFISALGFQTNDLAWYFYYPLLLILVLPLYPFLLICTGFVFGQFKFFFPIAKKILKSIGLGFVFK